MKGVDIIMNKKMTISIAVVFFIIFIFVYKISLMGRTDENLILSKYSNSDTQSIVSKLEKMSKQELLDEFNKIQNMVSIDEMIYWASEIDNRKHQFSYDELIEEIKNPKNSKLLRDTLVDIYFSKENYLQTEQKSTEKIKNLIKSDLIDDEIRSKIIILCNFNIDDTNFLIEIIKNNNQMSAFNALKQLRKVNPQEAFEIAYNIFKTRENRTDLEISASQKCLSILLREFKDKEIEEEFVKGCLDIIESGSNNDELVDSSIFALSDMMSKEGIDAIVRSSSIKDISLKRALIIQNIIVLKNLIDNKNPTQEEVELVVLAMEICPIKDFYNSLKKINVDKFDNDFLKRYENVLIKIETEGEENYYQFFGE